MFPSPVRALMKFESISPMVQRMMSSMMSWVMHDEDAKVQAGQVLREINKVDFRVPFRFRMSLQGGSVGSFRFVARHVVHDTSAGVVPFTSVIRNCANFR